VEKNPHWEREPRSGKWDGAGYCTGPAGKLIWSRPIRNDFRVPYIDEVALYKRYRFDEPWDGPNNIQLLDEMPRVYACPSHTSWEPRVAGLATPFGILACGGGIPSRRAQSKYTSYAAVLGKHCIFRGAEPVALDDITDGTSNTAMVGEITDAQILWTKPEDIDIAQHPRIGDRLGFSSDHSVGAMFLMADGSVHFLRESALQATIDALYTRDGGESITPDF